MSAKEISVEDVGSLQAEISENFGEWGREIEITQERINGFAHNTEDEQWIHTDPERAKKESPFRTTIAHGFLVLSLLPALLPVSNAFVFNDLGMMINSGIQDAVFLNPVPVGSRLHEHTRLVAVEKVGKRTSLTYDVEMAIVGSEKIVLRVKQKLLLVRKK